MGKATKPVFKKDSASLIVDLEALFGGDVPNNSQFRQAVGQAIIDTIIARTMDGVSFKGFNFKKYSKDYIESPEFEAFDKSPGDVNLTASGDMLGLMDIIDESPTTITIGWQDDVQNAKAYNHNVGDTVPARPFLGLTSTEEDTIAELFVEDLQSINENLENEVNISMLVNELVAGDGDVDFADVVDALELE